MEINLNNIQTNSPTSSNAQTGAAAPQTETQRVDQTAQRVTNAQDSAKLENSAADADGRRFDVIKSRAARYVSGDNPFLNDIKFTIYGQSSVASAIGEYEIRFTDLGTGKIDIKTEAQLFAGTEGGDVVKGEI